MIARLRQLPSGAETNGKHAEDDLAQDMEKRIGQYVALRDALELLQKRHDEEKKPLSSLLQKVGGVIQAELDASNTDSVKTKAGTAYTSVKHTATVADPDGFMKFVIEKGLFDLLERRANSTAVKDYVQKHNSLPTGVNLNALASIGVRRPTKQKPT